MANEESAIPEWDLFPRLEKLELKFTDTETLLQDTAALAKMAFTLAFMNTAERHPEVARKIKDDLMAAAKDSGISRESLGNMEKILLSICKWAEKRSNK